MLSNEAIGASLQLADVVESRGIVVTAHPETPLGALITASRVNSNFVSTNGDAYSFNIQDVVFMANNPDEATGVSDHDRVADDIVKIGVPAIQEEIRVARSVVAPLIDDLVTRATVALSNTNVSALLGMEVIVVDEPAPFTNSSLIEMVAELDTVPYDSPALNMRCAMLPVSDIRALMKTGVSSLDKDVDLWLSIRGEAFLAEVWEKFFTVTPVEGNAPVVTFRSLVEDKQLGNERALAVYLLARRMIDDVPDGVTMSDAVYNNLIASYRDQAGKVLHYAVGDVKKTVENGNLVRDYTNNKVWVNGPVYATWLANGGSNEVLFGNLLNTIPHLSVAALDENAAGLLAAWKRFEHLTGAVEQNKRFIRIKEALSEVFKRQLHELAAEEIITLGGEQAVVKRFEDVLSGVTDDELNNLYAVACKLICRSRFYKTKSEQVLLGIDSYAKNNPGIDVREAAAISILEYICDWVATQFTVRSIK